MKELETLLKYLPTNTRKQMEVHLTGTAKPAGKPRTLDAVQEGELIRAYMHGSTLAEVGKHFGVSKSLVHATLKRNDVQRRRTGHRFIKDTSKVYDVGRLINEGLTQSEIADKLGISRQRVHQVVKRYY